jgi:hypothetical protein
MPNQLISGTVNQGTTLGVIVANQLVTGGAKQRSSQACIIDLTLPTFAGISFLNVGVLGQLQVQWLAATDPALPIRYEIYVQANTATNLFNLTNIALVTEALNADVFALASGQLIQAATQYFVGVRAIDGVGNRDINSVSLSQISPGITGANLATISGIFSINETNQLIGSFWVTDSIGVISSALRLGTASYVIYDKNGNLVPGMAQSGIVADAQGFFKISAVASVLDDQSRLGLPVEHGEHLNPQCQHLVRNTAAGFGLTQQPLHFGFDRGGRELTPLVTGELGGCQLHQGRTKIRGSFQAFPEMLLRAG